MAIKSYTNINQSRKLAEILPIESADMYYWCADHYPKEDWIIEVGEPDNNYECIPCWSLAALLSVLPLPRLIQDKADDELFWQCSAYDEDGILLCEIYDNNDIDACYEMILKLNELKML